VACQSNAPEAACLTKDAIYCLACRECTDTYNGETERSFGTRIKEHNDDARNRVPGKPWGDHYRSKHPEVHLALGTSAFSEASVIAVEPDRARRKIREALEIRNRKPEVNMNAGWSLL